MISEDEFLQKVERVPLQKLNWSLAKEKNVEMLLRRDDLIDDYVSGNKFYKLFYNFQAAVTGGFSQVLSYGGVYSNHIYALAAAAKEYGFKSIGVIRGERPKYLSPTLKDAEAWGMKLHFISRTEYRNRGSLESRKRLEECYGEFFEIPEGGANQYGIKGAQVLGEAIYRQVKSDYTSICVASGTANTLIGISMGLSQVEKQGSSETTFNCDVPYGKVLGFSVLKDSGNDGPATLGHAIVNCHRAADKNFSNWRLISGFHGGGYGKKLPINIRDFMLKFEYESTVKLDPVYTVKMVWGVNQLLLQNYWAPGSRIILVHTGGLQGRRGFNLD